MAEFWMVWVEGRAGPTKRHPTKDAARGEAERLARQRENIGLPVHLLKQVASCRVQTPPLWTEEV